MQIPPMGDATGSKRWRQREDEEAELEEAHRDKCPNYGFINLDLEGDQVRHDGGNSFENLNEPIKAPWIPASLSMVARSPMLTVLLRLLRSRSVSSELPIFQEMWRTSRRT